MDMLTRKKFLLRKYNNSTFTMEELDFFGKINATEIVVLLKQNPFLRASAIFFEHTSIREIQKVIASIFQPDDYFAKSDMFNIMVNILRDSTMLLEVCFSNADFNYMSLFGFLDEDHIDYSVLILLEDVLLPYIRKTPFQIMDIISSDDEIQEIFLRRAYEKPIFKILYTVVFCLSKRHSDLYKDNVRKVIHQLVNTPFTYLLHRQKKSQQKIRIIGLDKTQIRQVKKSKKIDSSIQFSPVHKKQVRQRKSPTKSPIKSPIKGSVCSIQLMDEYGSNNNAKMQKNFSLMEQMLMSQSSEDEQLHFSQKSLRDYQQHPLIKISNFRMHSSTEIEIESKKQIPLNEDLDYGDLTENMKELLSDIAVNIKYVYLKNVIFLLENFNESYIDSLITNCKRFLLNEQYESYCEGAIYILLEFGELYRAVIKQSLNIPNNNRSEETQPPPTEYEADLNNLIAKLLKEIKIIASKLPTLCACLLQNNEVTTSYSSGQRIKKVGTIKFMILSLINQILSFNSHTNSECYLDLSTSIDFYHVDLFEIVEKYLTTVKWNNITHSLLVKITQLALEQDYEGFRERCLVDIAPKDSIIGTLIELFRNKKFVYLINLKFTNYGNIDAVSQITQLISNEVINHGDYNLLVEKFPVFQSFLNRDVIEYQKTLGKSELFDDRVFESQNRAITCSVPCEDMNGKIVTASLQNVEQLISKLQISKRWVASAFNTICQQTI